MLKQTIRYCALFSCLTLAFSAISNGAAVERTGRNVSRTLLVPAEYPTIQAAIDASQDNDVIRLADGVYTGQGNRDIDFGGRAITVVSDGGPENCIIDCEGSVDDPHRGFIFQSGETASSVLDGVTIMNGATEVGAVLDRFNGAAILCNNGSGPMIRNCIFTANNAACWGGAVCASSANPTLENVLFHDNYVGDDGGALFAWGNSDVTIRNSTIVNNYSGVTGGAVTSFGGFISIENCTIVGNEAQWGSAIYASWNTKISNSIIWGNFGDSNDIQLRGPVDIAFSNVEGNLDSNATTVGLVSVPPMFVDSDNLDFHLMAGSPMIDAGDPDYYGAWGATDIDGDPRVMHGRVDMGADEATTTLELTK